MNVENSEPIAIVGIGCRLPGEVNGPESYWKLLCEGTDALGDIPADRLPIDAFYHPEPGRPGKTYVRTGGFLDGIDQFDAEFFGISPKEASRIDPQQRLTLECTWEALEDAGADPGQLATKKIGVFIGISTDEYLHLQACDPQSINAYTNTGGRMCIAANRISYVLDLKGPSETVETACSSSLVAVHRACQSLHTGESETALAGGVNVILSLEAYVGYCQATMLSPTGRCWSFDSRADGYVRGEGCGIVVLKRLSQAEADGDRIYAVLLATGTNQDGRTLGLSRPSADAQSALLREVYGKAGVMPANVHYVEAHGTGTPAGDPIECEALGRVLGQQRAQALQIGSVKTNIGHLHAAAGIAGLIKTALSIQHRQLPPSLNFELPNPEIPLDRLGLSVHTSLTPWPSKGPALAGVNSFGFGGTNAHVVVGEYRAVKSEALTKKPFRPPFVLPLSAQCEGALKQLATRYAKRIRGCDDAALTDICYSAARRGQLPVRAAV
ncbi:MAG: beta-ketoacyl synthase N-terminal-like domain-containing protein, partial [Planctomycetaceae bacterium]